MRKILSRLHAIKLQLQSVVEKFSSRKYVRAGLYVSVLAAGFFAASPVFAVDVPTGVTVTDSILLTLAEVGIWITGLLSKLILVMIQMLMPIMLYNSFTSSPVVSSGWAIVRDTVNMFFVIILIAIAFGTIFGSSRFNWTQNIVKLMIFAIVINFSKTLCGIMIDFGQVVMLTFANAIRSIAAGNFIQMFGLTDAVSINASAVSTTGTTATGPQAFDWFAASFAAVFMMLIVLGTMLMLVAILLYRVVMLWVLIVISPLTWFIGGTDGIIHSDAYKTWWKKFTCLVAIGPVLTFFLWLTLVVAGSGTVGEQSNIVSTGADNANLGSGGFMTSLFQMNKLISFVISIAMLYAGFEAAQGVCHGAGMGGIDSLMKGGPTGNLGVRAARGAIGASVRLGGKGLAMGTKKISEKTGLGELVTSGKESMYGAIAAGAGAGLIGKTIGRAASAQKDKLAAGRMENIAAKGEKYKGDSRQSIEDQAKRFADVSGNQAEGAALLGMIMKDPKSVKAMEANGSLQSLVSKYGSTFEKGAKGNHEAEDSLNAFKKQNAHIEFGGKKSTDEISSVEDVMALSSFALADADVKKRIGEIQGHSGFRDADGNDMSMSEALLAGKLGAEKRKVFESGDTSAVYENMSAKELSRVDDSILAKNGSNTVLSKPEVMARMAGSQDSVVRAALQARATSGKPEDETLFTNMAAGAGLDLATGNVIDEAALKAALKKNPALLNNMSAAAFSKVKGNAASSHIISEALAEKGVLDSAVKDIKKDPNASANTELASRISSIMSSADASVAVSDAAAVFGAHVEAADSRNKQVVASVVAAAEAVKALQSKKDALNATIDDGDTEMDEYKKATAELEKVEAQLQSAQQQSTAGVKNIAAIPNISDKLDAQLAAKTSELSDLVYTIADNELSADSKEKFLKEAALNEQKTAMEANIASIQAVKAQVETLNSSGPRSFVPPLPF